MKNKFSTLEEANAAQDIDYQAWKEAVGDPENEYWKVTKKWDEPRQALDGFWYYDVCPLGVQTHEQIKDESVTFIDEQ